MDSQIHKQVGYRYKFFNCCIQNHKLSGEKGIVALLVVQLQIHPVMDLVIFQSDVVLEDGVPLLQHDLVPLGSGLSRDQLLEVPDGVVLVALNANFLP